MVIDITSLKGNKYTVELNAIYLIHTGVNLYFGVYFRSSLDMIPISIEDYTRIHTLLHKNETK